jgi:phage replication-related protein YjqB (UPF0714/DUF867 family)
MAPHHRQLARDGWINVHRYTTFTELSRHEAEDRDYRIHLRLGVSGIAVLAPHGGKIERGTLPIAHAIAGEEHTFYAFEGIKPTLKANRALHVPSNHFDEPRALFAVAKAHRVLTLHGAKGTEEAVYAGGLDLELRLDVLRALNAAGFTADHDPSPTRQGRGPTNICNRGSTGRGLQLELTFGLRKQLFGPPDEQGIRHPNTLFHQFVMAIREVLRHHTEQGTFAGGLR